MISTSQAVWLTGLLALTVTAIVTDLRWRRIPNWLTVAGFGLGVTYHVAQGAVGAGAAGALHGLGTALAGFGTGFGLLLVLWLIGAGGGGDVKLMGAVGAWLGFRLTLYVLVASAVFIVLGGMAVLFVSMVTRGPVGFRRRHLESGPSQPGASRKGGREKGHAPFDPALDAATKSVQRAARVRAQRRLMPFALPLGLGTWVIVAWVLLAPHGAR